MVHVHNWKLKINTAIVGLLFLNIIHFDQSKVRVVRDNIII